MTCPELRKLTFLRQFPSLVFQGRFQGRSIQRPESSSVVRAQAMYLGVAECLSFMRRLSKEFQVHVMKSHGDHIPMQVRDAATFLFAIPLHFPNIERTLQYEYLLSTAISRVAAWVRQQVCQSYTWPPDEAIRTQYDVLIARWKEIIREGENFRDANGMFLWNQFWQDSHTKAAFAPQGTEAAFLLYNFTGMWGTSEAEAESVGSLLKFYGRTKTLSFERIVERVKLRHEQVDGLPRCDLFMLRVWAAFFGETNVFRFQTKRPSARRRRWQHGGGSKTLHKVIQRDLDRPAMAAQARKKVGEQPKSGAQWRTFAAKKRKAANSIL